MLFIKYVLGDPWVQSIGGGLIVAGLIWFAGRFQNRRLGEILLPTAIGSIVFTFGQFLQPSVQYAIEGNNPYWALFSVARDNDPAQFFFWAFVLGVCFLEP